MILNLRGTNGSGKSTVAFDFLTQTHEKIELARYATPKGEPRAVVGYRVPSLDLILVGPYETACGGCDAIKTQPLVKESVAIAARFAKHVLFEGVIVSTLFSGYLELSKKMRDDGHKFVWAYLDTPLEVCLARIQKRNGGKPIKEDLVYDKIRSINATRHKALAAREDVVMVNYKKAAAQVREIFDER